MRPIGFSTGALAYADFRRGLAMTRAAACAAVELSALRQAELFPLLESLNSLDLTGFDYISRGSGDLARPTQRRAEALCRSR